LRLVPSAEVVDPQSALPSTFEPRDVLLDVVLRPEAAVDPARGAPGQSGQRDRPVATPRLLHQPPLVASTGIDLAAPTTGARLGAGRGVDVTTDLDPEDLQGGSDPRREEQVEDPAARGLGVVDQEPRRRTRRERTDAVEPSSGITRQGDRLLCAHRQHARRSVPLLQDSSRPCRTKKYALI